jgi:T-complex protein 1 subunit theta
MEVKEVGSRKIIMLNQVHDEDTSVATIIVRASTENVINDVERALDDGIQSVKTLCADGRLLPGAGTNTLRFPYSVYHKQRILTLYMSHG